MKLPSFGRVRKDRFPAEAEPQLRPDTDSPGPSATRPGLLERPGFGYVQTVETVRRINRALLGTVMGLLVAIGLLSVALMSARDHVTVYVPPDLTRGHVVTAGEPNGAAVHAFAARILQGLYHWPQDGQEDYPAAIDRLAPYLTPAFRRALEEDLSGLTNRGGINEIGGRTRVLHPLPGQPFEPERTVRLGQGVWSVTLGFRLVETFGAAPIKDIRIRYVVRAVRSDIDPQHNAWGMQLDGFLREPVRLQQTGGGT